MNRDFVNAPHWSTQKWVSVLAKGGGQKTQQCRYTSGNTQTPGRVVIPSNHGVSTWKREWREVRKSSCAVASSCSFSSSSWEEEEAAAASAPSNSISALSLDTCWTERLCRNVQERRELLGQRLPPLPPLPLLQLPQLHFLLFLLRLLLLLHFEGALCEEGERPPQSATGCGRSAASRAPRGCLAAHPKVESSVPVGRSASRAPPSSLMAVAVFCLRGAEW